MTHKVRFLSQLFRVFVCYTQKIILHAKNMESYKVLYVERKFICTGVHHKFKIFSKCFVVCLYNVLYVQFIILFILAKLRKRLNLKNIDLVQVTKKNYYDVRRLVSTFIRIISTSYYGVFTISYSHTSVSTKSSLLSFSSWFSFDGIILFL